MSEPVQLDPEILEGRAEDVPPLSSKIVRVFLSSTFSGKNFSLSIISYFIHSNNDLTIVSAISMSDC